MTVVTGVLLVDDDSAFRAVYRRLLDRGGQFRVVGEAGTLGEARALLRSLRPALAVVDVQMPDGTGLDLLSLIADEGLETRVIVLTTFDLDEYVAAALHSGAAGFLLKNASPSEVLSALRAVRAGHASLAPEVTARLLDQFSPRAGRPRHAFADRHLTERELDVARLVARGHSNQQIAAELQLSHETVRTYLKRMFAKLDVADRTELAVLTLQAGLLYETR